MKGCRTARHTRWVEEYLAGAQVWDMAKRDAVAMGTIYSALKKHLGPSPRPCGCAVAA